jgi:hypothetical protein
MSPNTLVWRRLYPSIELGSHDARICQREFDLFAISSLRRMMDYVLSASIT